MRFQSFSTLEELHLEITNRCNAACPMCSRNEFGGKDKSTLISGEWTSDDADIIFDHRLEKLRNILFCGTHGDPAVAKDCLTIVEKAKSGSSATVEFYSNGSVRNTDWWYDLGGMLNTKNNDGYYRKNDLAVFSIDGLSDTNHIYRRRTNYEKIMANAESFIKAGGYARWDFLVFKHNEHQVEEAEKIAKKMGFKNFRIRKTSRFAHSPDGPNKHRVLGNNGELEYYIEAATQDKYINKNKKEFDQVIKNEKEGLGQLKESINCLNKSEFNRMYINAHLKVFPCCFISSDTYSQGTKVYRDVMSKVISKYGDGFNSLKKKKWEDILDHPWFKAELSESWESEENKLIRCQRTCNSKCNPITSQSQDVSI